MKTLALCISSAVIALAIATPASAAVIILPDAVSYEYYGLNYVDNLQTSNTVGTLDYTGHPGCGSTCTATTALGSSPYVSASLSEVYFDIFRTSGGIVEARLGYYVEYLNLPGTYSINMHAIDSLSVPDGSAISASLRFGPAAGSTTSFNNFSSVTFQEADCVNRCPAPGFAIPNAPLVADNLVQMAANTPYYIELDLLLNPTPSGVQISGLIDPTFSSTDGGQFIFSPGVTGDSTPIAAPEPTTWAMFLLGLGGIGWTLRKRRSSAAAPA